jgi:hypothetical protein
MVYRYPSSGLPQQTSAGRASRSALIAVKTRDRDERAPEEARESVCSSSGRGPRWLLLQTDYDRPFVSAEPARISRWPRPCSNCGHIECKIDRRDGSNELLLRIWEHAAVGSRGVRTGRRVSRQTARFRGCGLRHHGNRVGREHHHDRDSSRILGANHERVRHHLDVPVARPRKVRPDVLSNGLSAGGLACRSLLGSLIGWRILRGGGQGPAERYQDQDEHSTHVLPLTRKIADWMTRRDNGARINSTV